MIKVKRLVFFLVVLLCQPMVAHADKRFAGYVYLHNCCNKGHVFSVIGINGNTFVPPICGKTKWVKKRSRHAFLIREICKSGSNDNYNFNGAKNGLKVKIGSYIKTVSKNNACIASHSNQQAYNGSC